MESNKLAIDILIDKIKEKDNPSAVGLDTVLSYLPEDYAEKCKDFYSVSECILDFNRKIIDAVCGIIPAVKIQIACYEMYGHEGIKAFEDTVSYAKGKGLAVIADAKRNDIGSTAKCYSDALIGRTDICGSDFEACGSSFVTVNGYLGFDGIKPFTDDCAKYGRGLFILVKTSNPGSGEFQDRVFTDGRTLYETMGDYVAEWGKPFIGKYGYSSIGAVVGATHRAQAENLRKRLKSVFFLIPGYGAQGGKAEDIAVCFDNNGIGGIVNSSRAVLTAYKSEKYRGMPFYAAAREAALEMKEDLNRALKKG